MKSLYIANYLANDNTRLDQDLKDSNFKRIVNDIREIADGNRFAGNSCRWYVYRFIGNKSGKCTLAAAGGVHSNGRRYREHIKNR